MQAKKRAKGKRSEVNQLRLPLFDGELSNSTGSQRIEVKLFPERLDQFVTLKELSAATDIPRTRLRDWATKGRLPGGMRPAKRCQWEFRRETIEKWWADLLAVD